MNIIDIGFEGFTTITLSVNWIAIVILGILVVLVGLGIKKIIHLIGRRSISVDQASIGIGNSSVTLKLNKKDQEIAYKLWVELSTRKIGLPYDEENDVIIEVYDSWYSFFKIARDLLKEIPVERLAYSRELVELTQKVLNDGLRPHLTRWQAKYRKWAKDVTAKEGTPQDIQKSYPEYDMLILDLKKTNLAMINYKNLMYKIAFDKK